MKIKINDSIIDVRTVDEIHKLACEQVARLNLEYGGGFTLDTSLKATYKVYYEILINDLLRAIGPLPIPTVTAVVV